MVWFKLETGAEHLTDALAIDNHIVLKVMTFEGQREVLVE